MTATIEAAEIRALHAAWLTAERDGRPEDVLELCTPGIVFQPPIGAPAEGLEAVRALLGPREPLHLLEAEEPEISVSERLAVLRARFVSQARAGGPVLRGHHLWVLRPRWRVAMASWSFDAPAE